MKNFTQVELKNIKHLINIQEVELQNLKYLIETNNTKYKKLTYYSNQCVDPQIKQTFNKAAQDALNAKSKLVSFLNS